MDEVKQKRSVIASLGCELDLSAIRLIRKEGEKRSEKLPFSPHCEGGEALTPASLIPSPQRTHWRSHSYQSRGPAGNAGLSFPPNKGPPPSSVHVEHRWREREHKGV